LLCTRICATLGYHAPPLPGGCGTLSVGTSRRRLRRQVFGNAWRLVS